MKRHLPALIIGLIAGGIVMALYRSGVFLRAELAISDLLSGQAAPTRLVRDKWQYVFVFILALSVAWMTSMTSRRARLGGIIAILVVELLGVAWVCSLYQVLFQPLPAIGGTAFGFLLPIGYLELAAFVKRRRERAPVLSVEAVAAKPRARAKRTDLAP